MLDSQTVRIAVLGLLASGAMGCNLQIDQIFAMQDGSALQTFLVSNDGTLEIPQGTIAFEGGAVMRIKVSTDLLDYLDGTVDGDVELPDLLFAIPGLQFFIANTGLICVVPGDPPGGGTFEYNVLGQTAAFDVQINTEALPVDPVYQRSIKDADAGGALLGAVLGGSSQVELTVERDGTEQQLAVSREALIEGLREIGAVTE